VVEVRTESWAMGKREGKREGSGEWGGPAAGQLGKAGLALDAAPTGMLGRSRGTL
jgi:hypothetical protein